MTATRSHLLPSSGASKLRFPSKTSEGIRSLASVFVPYRNASDVLDVALGAVNLSGLEEHVSAIEKLSAIWSFRRWSL